MDNILHSTSTDVDQVTIEPDGKWSSPKADDSSAVGGVTPATDDDDELIEIKEPGITPVKQESIPLNLSLQRTPAQSREPSTSSAAHRSTNKRLASQVIDLTGSDEDDDNSPVRPAKRPALNALNRTIPRQELRASVGSSLVNERALPISSQDSSKSPSQGGNYDT